MSTASMVKIKSRSVLVITNHPLSAMRMRAGLRALPNCHISFAFDEIDARQLACLERPNLIVVDYQASDRNNFALVAELRRFCPDSIVIILAARINEENCQYAAALSIHRILKKPVSPAELYQVALLALAEIP